MPRRVPSLLALIAVLAAFLFLWDKPREQRRRLRQEQESLLLPIDPAVVDTLRLRRVPESVLLVRQPGPANSQRTPAAVPASVTAAIPAAVPAVPAAPAAPPTPGGETPSHRWMLLSPVREPADGEVCDGLVRGLTAVHALQAIVTRHDTTAWVEFGLAPNLPGVVRVEVAGPAGQRAALWVGHENPQETAVYVRRDGRDEIELAPPEMGKLARLSHQGLRNYDLFAVSRDSIDWVSIASGKGRWSARRNGRGLWFTEETPPRQLKRYEVDLLVYDLATQRIQRYVEDNVSARHWSAFGLHAPILDISFTAALQPERIRRVALGNQIDQTTYYARRDTLRSVLALGGPLLSSGERSLAQLLETNPVPDNYDRLDSLTIRWLAGGSCTAVHQGRDWTMRLPAGWKGDKARLETPLQNVVHGLETLESTASASLGKGRGFEAIAPVQRVACALFWPDRSVRLRLGWHSGEDFHWLHVDGEQRAHRIGRDLYFRLYSLLLGLGVIPGENAQGAADSTAAAAGATAGSTRP
jgi:hypothetical protein